MIVLLLFMIMQGRLFAAGLRVTNTRTMINNI